VRRTLYLDEDLDRKLRTIIPSRQVNGFIVDAVRDKLKQLERSQIEALMIEGYKTSAVDQRDVDDDWSVLETENWPG
jgi:hypothetical protein